MTATVSQSLTYRGTTVAEVAEMLGDAGFREEVAAYQRALRSSAEVTGGGAGRRVRIEIVHGTTHIPSFARKFVGEEIPIVQEETWTSESHADVLVTIPGKPGDMTGTIDLTQDGDDVVEQVDLKVKVGIPLVGGKLEGLIAGLLNQALRAENQVGREWLTR